eukprot:m.118733 g.118733  ORF g.118733 m.118733 type:complete len:59 (-) comp15572_c0_seq4:29-205(-)
MVETAYSCDDGQSRYNQSSHLGWWNEKSCGDGGGVARGSGTRNQNSVLTASTWYCTDR